MESIKSAPSSSFSGRSESSRSINCIAGMKITLDLVASARRHLSFLRFCSSDGVVDGGSEDLVRRSIRRYEELWMPLISEFGADEMLLLPPLDVHWIWHCHSLNHSHYRNYCNSRFNKLINRPAIFDEENEEYATDRCREIWESRYPSELFDLEYSYNYSNSDNSVSGSDLFEMIEKCRSLGGYYEDAFMSETVYLVAAKRRYLNFVNLLKEVGEKDFSGRLVPTSDIYFMWLTHQSFPASYARDTSELGDVSHKIAGFLNPPATTEEIEETKRLWEEEHDEPYERAGMAIDPIGTMAREIFNWEVGTRAEDVNRVYKGLQPRFLMEVCVFTKGNIQDQQIQNKRILRLRLLRCHKSLKLDQITPCTKKWHKSWHLFCEFGTKGITIETREKTKTTTFHCISKPKSTNDVTFTWNELVRATNLVLAKDLGPLRGLVSVTPPVQANYLLKCVSDRVTDDNGAMVCDVVLRERAYRPQEGRWLTRTVLDHSGRECFVIRTRVGKGIWRRGAETPIGLKYEERIVEVREGQWSYIGGSVGYAPDKVVGTATPKREDQRGKTVIWTFSTGDVLTIDWENNLQVHLENETTKEKASLVRGRRLQYQTNKKHLSTRNNLKEDEENYFTLVRPSLYNKEGKATTLINLKLLAIEFSRQEDSVVILLTCMALAHTLSEIRREDFSGLLVRRRVQEMQVGQHDWGSVLLPLNSSDCSVHAKPWYWNAHEVLVPAEKSTGTVISTKYSPADGKDQLYRQAIMS
ncbi:hypothetical protein LUZ60_011437 [Juncus effusus]|nr:hypothetical protein LUZ60_011437 [Juncus effusus]